MARCLPSGVTGIWFNDRSAGEISARSPEHPAADAVGAAAQQIAGEQALAVSRWP